LIFLFSGEDSQVSDSRSRGITNQLVEVYEKISQQEISDKQKVENQMNHIIRKTAHYFLYFVLGILVFSCFLEYGWNIQKIFLFTIAFCFLYAFFDEFHQLFISGRSGQLQDVFLDTFGSITSTCLLCFVKKCKK